MHVPGLEARHVEGGGHLAVAVGALLPDDRHLEVRPAGEHGVRRRRRHVRQHVGRGLPVLHAGTLLLDALGVALLELQAEGGRLPDIVQRDHGGVEDVLPADARDDAEVGPRLADLDGVHAGRVEDLVGLGELRPVHLVDDAGRLAEELRKHRLAVRRGQLERDADAPGEGHLQHRGDEAAVRPVVAGGEQAGLQQGLRRVEGRLQLRDVDVGRVAGAGLADDLREGRAAERGLPGADVHEEQHALALRLEVRRHLHAHVRHRRIGGHHELAGTLHRLGAAVLRHARRHGERVLAAVDGHAELDAHGTDGLGGVVHLRALALQLRGPHPVARGLDGLQRGDRHPHEVGDGLGDRQARHGLVVLGVAAQALHGRLAESCHAAGVAHHALGDHGEVRERGLQRPDALLLRHEARHGAVDLVREEALRADGHEAQHAHGERRLDQEAGGQGELLLRRDDARHGEDLLRHLAEHQVQRQVHGNAVVAGVPHDHAPVAGDLAHDGVRGALALADAVPEREVLFVDEEAVVLLEFGGPELEEGHRGVAHEHLADVDLGAGRLRDLLQHVAGASGALVVDGQDGVLGAELHAGADDAVDTLQHLGVAALNGVEVELGLVVARDHGGGRAAADADSVGRAADLHDGHAGLRLRLREVPVVHGAEAATQHDGLHILEALAGRQAVPEGARPAAEQGLAELVAVVARAVRGVDEDLEGRRHVARVLRRLLLLPLHVVALHVEVADGVARDAGHHEGALPRALAVAHPAARTRLGAREGRDAAREVVGLHGARQVVVALRLLEGPDLGRVRLLGEEGGVLEAAERAAVVVEGDDAVGGVLLEGFLHQLEERAGHLLAVDHDLAPEEPVAAVLGVALGQVEALHLGRVALELVPEDAHVVVQVLLVVAEAVLLAHVGEGLGALLHHRHGRPALGLRGQLEGADALRIRALGHAIVEEGLELAAGVLGRGRADAVAARPLNASHLAEADGLADGDRVRRPRGGKLHARPHLDDGACG
mmetsp:Transcript_82949/g.179067  ORF Transcript_82949/g.179067 Transcript_82949/m.179067 type:complete len:1004 (+) Transcript_82949:3602-6613(+)